MKTIEKSDIQTLLKNTSMRRFHQRRSALADKLLTFILPYTEKGIANADDELDFCSAIEEILDSGSGCQLTADERVAVCQQIYDALGFQLFWQG